ncbi:MAG: hypothetical protein CVV53_03795 [Spirochaetae bacterium HGW-Spirochaetae-9]|nr:MAG: hypothetical protein CVV53_03795 [Spirochaetae bacterium HGW-Spirochaetae-9]
MSAIETMLQNEYMRLYRTVTRLREECLQRPRGSLAVKRRGNGFYMYLVKREGGKVVTEYIGKAGAWKAKGVEAKILERHRYEAELKEAEGQLAKLRKMMKASGVFFIEPSR